MKKTIDTFAADAFTRDSFTIDSVDLRNDMSDESSDDSDMDSLLSSFKSLSIVSFTDQLIVDSKGLVKPQARKNTNRPEFLSPVVPINREAKARLALSNRGGGSAFAKNPEAKARLALSNRGGSSAFAKKPKATASNNVAAFQKIVDNRPKHSEKGNRHIVLGENDVVTQANLTSLTRGRQPDITQGANNSILGKKRSGSSLFKPAAKIFNTGAKTPKVIVSNQVAAFQKIVDGRPKHSEKENRYIVLGENGIFRQANLPSLTRARQPDITQGANNSILSKKRPGCEIGPLGHKYQKTSDRDLHSHISLY